MKQAGQKEFLEALFNGVDEKNYIDIRTFKVAGDKLELVDYFFERIKDLDRLIKLLGTKHFKNLNVHFGVAPRCLKSGTEKDVKILRCFWCDVDCRRKGELGLPTKKEALEKIKKFKMSPSVIVDSGNGYHIYWLLSEQIDIKGSTHVLELRGILAGLSRSLGGDVAGKDLCRLLRLPNTLNLKPENPEGLGLPVKIVKFDKNITYNLKDFEPFYLEQEETILGEVDLEKNEIKNWIRNPESLELPENFYRLLELNKKLRETFSGNRPDLNDQTKSGYSMSLASLLIRRGIFTDEQIIKAMILQPRAKGRKKTPQNLLSTLKKAKGSFKGERKKKEPELKTFPPGLILLVDNEGVKKYLFKDEAGNLAITETWTNGAGQVYKPRQDLKIGYASMEVLNIDKGINWSFLLKNIEKYIKGHLELPDEIYYLIFGLWIMHTYLMEKLDVTPYLYFVGLKGTGKSRAGKVALKLSYKCLPAVLPSPAVIFRAADFWENGLVIDEAKFWGSDMDRDLARIIMSRYQRGMMVPRVNRDKKGEAQIELHNVFGPTIICTMSNIPEALEDRCIKIQMKRNVSPAVTGDFDLAEEQRLINLLALFRAKYYNKEFPKHKNIARWRLGEILSSLYKILLLADKSRIEEFEEFVKSEETSRAVEEATSDNATIIGILIDFYNEGRDIVSTQEIAKSYNQDIENLNLQISPKSMGWKTKPFNFKKKVIIKWKQNNKPGWIIDRETLIELAKRFSIETEIIPIDEHHKKVKEETQLNMPD